MVGYIYQIYNCTTKDCYIGSTVHLYKRKHLHIKSLKENKHYNKHLQNAYNLYKGNFKFLIIEELLNCTKEELILKEQLYIDRIQPRYNIYRIAYSPLGYKHTPEAIEKIRQASLNASIETRYKQSIALLGISKSKEHSANISKSKLGKRMKQESIDKMAKTKVGMRHSQASNLARSITMMGKNAGYNNKRSIPIVQLKLENNELVLINEWPSRNEIFRKLGFDGARIQKVCKRNDSINLRPYGFIWQFKHSVIMKENNKVVLKDSLSDKASKTVMLSNLFVNS